MNPITQMVDLIHTQRRRTRGTPLVWAAALAVAAQAWAGAVRLGWLPASEHWALLPAILAAGLLGWWFRQARQTTEATVARELDGRWQLHARLETAVELSRDDSAMAAAQRTDAATRVAGRKPTGIRAWRGGLALLGAALLFLGIESAVVVVRALHARAAAEAAAQKPAEEIQASIVWKSPDAKITATAVEEVPLTAHAESNTGFRTLSLEADVNGERVSSRQLDPAVLMKPGGLDLELSLYLDDLHVKPFDVVSYYLSGVPASARAVPPVVSALQFIQIRPPQPKLGKAAGDGTLISLIRQIKGAQLQLLQQNFTLAHADTLKGEAMWQTENQRVATEQSALAPRAGEALELARKQDAPSLVTDNLGQAESLIKKAGSRIEEKENEPATTLQRRVIALLAEIESLIGQAPGGPPGTADPFQNPQRIELPPREATAAGELERLAQRQRQINLMLENDRQTPPGTGRTPAGAAEQAALAREAEQLAGGAGLDPAALKSLGLAAVEAARVAQQLNADDRSAAREPAAAALAAFERALALQNQAGRATALAILDQVRRTLNVASRAGAAARTAGLGQARYELRAAAVEQQRSGSVEVAHQFQTLADAVNAPKGRFPEVSASEPDTGERARELAAAATRAQILFSTRLVALNRTVRQLHRVQPILAAGGEAGAAALADTELAGQEGEWLTTEAATTDLGRQLAGQADALLSGPGRPGAAGLAHAAETAAALARALETARDIGSRDEIVRRFRAEDIDPVYREAVETYFTKLSRGGTKP